MATLTRDEALVGIPRHPCPHEPPCPDWDTSEHDAAKVVDRHDEIGVSVLCNSVWIYDDTAEMLPNGVMVAPHRPEPRHEVHAQVDGASGCGRSGPVTTDQAAVDCWRCNGAVQGGAR